MSLWRWGIVFLLVIAVPMRLHSLDRSLWLDETWVANSLLEPDLAGLFYYDSWLQTTPPLFLVLERMVIDLLPAANWTFRLLPCLFGLLGVAAIACLTLRLLPPPVAFLVLFLFVFAPEHVILSQSLKPYASDLLVAIVLMGLALTYLQRRRTAMLLAAVGAFVLAACFSYNAVLFMPAFLFGALFAPPAGPARLPAWHVRGWHAVIVTVAVAATATINYALFIRPNLDRNILGGATDATFGSWAIRLAGTAANVVRIFKHFFFNAGAAWGGVWLEVWMVGAAVVAFFGLCDLCARGGRGRPRNLDRAAVLALPIAGAAIFDLAGYYPLAPSRLNLFLLPAVLLLFGSGLRALVLRARLRRRRARRPRGWLSAARPYAAVGIALALILVLRTAVHGSSPYFTWAEEDDEDAEAAVAYLAAVAGRADVVYVDTSMLEPLKLYARFTPIRGARLVPGLIGWVCCPRDLMPDLWVAPDRTLPQELDRIFAGGVRDRLWMFYTNRPYHWQAAGVNYADLFARSLGKRGCRLTEHPHLVGVRVDGYRCAGGGEPAAPARGPAEARPPPAAAPAPARR